MLGVGAVLPCSSFSSSELNPAIRSATDQTISYLILFHGFRLVGPFLNICFFVVSCLLMLIGQRFHFLLGLASFLIQTRHQA
ncbi:uncharacterized protein DS421_20g701490 [Arachis hypogaea]|nr:uncharacterized protein DS421_20g701490 [Arachis hypogaea]